jgi:hypothetical protein
MARFISVIAISFAGWLQSGVSSDGWTISQIPSLAKTAHRTELIGTGG